MDKYIVLENKEHQRFITTYIPGKDQTIGANGDKWYKKIGTTKTIPEAQKLCGYIISEVHNDQD